MSASTMVGSADEPEECIMTSRLSLLSFPVHSPDRDDKSGCSTPPFHISASVPFKWEEEPGKPIPCTALIQYTQPISLDLTPPPRMDPKVNKTSSPTTVLDGPYLSWGSSPERGQLGPMVMSNIEKEKEKKKEKEKVGRRLFGSWSWGSKRSGKKMGKREGFGGSFVFPSSAPPSSFDDGRECCSEYGGESECVGAQVKMKKSKSFISLAQVIPWKGSKLKKDGAST